MTTLRRVLTGTALAAMVSGLATADSIVSFTTTIGPDTTDVINTTLSLPAFDPGVDAPAGAVLDFYTISVTETINGTIDVTNSTANTFGAGALFGVDTLGAVSIGVPLTGDGQPDGVGGDATNDIFGGSGPDPKETLSVAGLTSGSSTGVVSYSKTKTLSTGDLTDGATTAPPIQLLYISQLLHPRIPPDWEVMEATSILIRSRWRRPSLTITSFPPFPPVPPSRRRWPLWEAP